MSKECEFCHQPMDGSKKRFCSYACRNRTYAAQVKAKRPNLVCPNCEKIFTVSPADLKRGRGKFCSRKCAYQFRHSEKNPDFMVIHRVCKNCERGFVVARSVLREGKHTGNFCSRSCTYEFRRKGEGFFGKKPYSGSEPHMDSKGYIKVYDPNHKKEVGQHIVVMEKILGRPLEPGETVHHKFGNRSDNLPEKLELWTTRHGAGARVSDLYHKDVERLALENYKLKQALNELRGLTILP